MYTVRLGVTEYLLSYHYSKLLELQKRLSTVNGCQTSLIYHPNNNHLFTFC